MKYMNGDLQARLQSESERIDCKVQEVSDELGQTIKAALKVFDDDHLTRVVSTAMTTIVKHNLAQGVLPAFIQACGVIADYGYQPMHVRALVGVIDPDTTPPDASVHPPDMGSTSPQSSSTSERSGGRLYDLLDQIREGLSDLRSSKSVIVQNDVDQIDRLAGLVNQVIGVMIDEEKPVSVIRADSLDDLKRRLGGEEVTFSNVLKLAAEIVCPSDLDVETRYSPVSRDGLRSLLLMLSEASAIVP